jgi:hypothetical protein
LTYANVVATIALVLAVSGGATAIALSLPKNSVTSKQLAKGAVKTVDLGKDAATGDKVNESTLGKVPSAVRADSATRADSAGRADSAATADNAAVATSLAGFEPGNLAKVHTVSSSFFTSSLAVTVSGYGTFRLNCVTNTASNTDDELVFGYTSQFGENTAVQSGYLAGSTSPGPATSDFVVSGPVITEGAGSEFGPEDQRLTVDYKASVFGTTKAIIIEGGGFDNESNAGCAGQLQAFVVS